MKALLVVAVVFFTFQTHADSTHPQTSNSAPDTASILRVAGDMSAILSDPDIKRIMTAGQPQSAVDYIIPSAPNTYEIQAQMSCATIQAHENVLANGQPVLGITPHPCEYTRPPSTIDYDDAAHEMLEILSDPSLAQRFDYKFFPDFPNILIDRLVNDLKPATSFVLEKVTDSDSFWVLGGFFGDSGFQAGFNYTVHVDPKRVNHIKWTVIKQKRGGGPGGGASVGN